jgi:DNA polymerase I-like protein with 3'-5' exonuclease and polymerase domains
MAYRIGLLIQNETNQRAPAASRIIQATIPGCAVSTLNLHVLVPDYWVAKANTKAKRQIGPRGREQFRIAMEKLAPRYDAFVTYDLALATHVLPARDSKALTSTDVLAGMIIERFEKPILFIADPLQIYGRQFSDEQRAVSGYITAFHCNKLKNHMHGTRDYAKPTKFVIAQSMADLQTLEKLASKSVMTAFDIETSGGYISVVGFALSIPGLAYTPVFVIPLLINLENETSDYWDSDAAFNMACATIGSILANPTPKCAHNGSFDIAHLFRYGWSVNNYILDTMHFFHAVFPTMPKALYSVSSMFVQKYKYWKDDGKEVDDQGKTKWEAPRTADRTYGYWLYNALDCANTLDTAMGLLDFVWGAGAGTRYPEYAAGFGHVGRTYIREFALQFGPALYMSMHGLPVPAERQEALREKLLNEARVKLAELQELVGDPDLNPNSSDQTCELIYDVLRAPILPRKGRTADKRVLQAVGDAHPIFREVIKAITDAKEPANNATKYGNLPLWYQIWLYKIKMGNTTTARAASSKHDFGIGTNMQNVPKSMRLLATAYPGTTLVSSDYSQSDSYFVAFESEDGAMIETVTDDRDTHSVHVEFFFGHKYADVVAGAAKKEPWVVHADIGVRQIIKKVSHGTNYDMGGGTMLLNVRKEAAWAMVCALLSGPNSAKFITYMGLDKTKSAQYYIDNERLWSNAQLEKACDFAQALYYMRYPALKRWKQAAVQGARINHGVITMYGGSSTVMLCDPAKNPRFIPASYGQGGTAGNINNAMLRLYYLADAMWVRGFKMIIQVHDELVCSVPDGRYDLVDRKVKIMEHPCAIKGRTFTIPVEAELTKSWQAKWTVKYEGLGAEKQAGYTAALGANESKVMKSLGLSL